MYVSLLQMAAPWLCLLGFVVICLFVLRQVLPIVCVFVLRQVLPAVQRTCHVDQTGFELTEIYLPLPLFFFFSLLLIFSSSFIKHGFMCQLDILEFTLLFRLA